MKSQSVILSSMLVQMKQTFSRNMYKMCLFISPLFSTIILAEMYKKSGSENFTAFVLLGSGLMSFWSCIVFSSIGDINRERWGNTLPLIFVAPCSFSRILIGKVLGNTVLSLFTFVITLLTSFVFYNKTLTINNLWQFSIAFIMMVICFIVVSLFFAYLLMLSRKTTIFMNCLEAPIYLICGFAFPIEILPLWAQFIAYPLPMTWAVKLLRLGVNGTDNITFFRTLLLLVLTTILFAVFAQIFYRLIDKQVRKTASLEVA